MSSQVEFYTFIGVVGFGFTISSNVVCTRIVYLVLIKRAAHSTSEADAIAFLIPCDMAKRAPLLSLCLIY